MNSNRWDWAKISLIPIPFLCLVAYLAGAPLPLPSFALPERRYLALGREIDPLIFSAARGSGEAFAVLPSGLSALPPAGAALENARTALPDEPILGPIAADLESGLGPYQKARVVLGRVPLAGELAALRDAAARVGAPLAIEIRSPPAALPLQALSLRYSPADRRASFDLLLAPEARGLTQIEVISGAAAGGSLSALAGRHLLYRSAGAGLPADLVLRLSVDRAEGAEIEVAFTGPEGKRMARRLSLGAGLEEQPRVLIVSDKGGATRSALESLYPARRATLAEAEGLDLHAYELVVIDGIPISRLKGPLQSGLLGISARRTGSILFAADSPDFGKKGDNPEIEELLPATLLPRSLKDLPDVAILILIDVSGSMFGDKLSLAKVTGLELLRQLKPGDRVGMMLFSDVRRWVYEFQPNQSITAAPVLEPLTAGGGTDLAPFLAEGLARLGGVPIQEKHCVLITDGVTRPADFQSLAEQARSLGISLSAMGVGADANRPLLERLALRSGGRYYPVASAVEIPALLFEDRTSTARPAFAQGKVPVLALNGERVATIGGMAQYTPRATASVIFTNDLGDPLFAGMDQGNRATLLFTSDLYGSYTSDFFSRPAAVGGFKDRLDALFAEKPAQIRVVEDARGITVLARSDGLTEPRLLLSRAGSPPLEADFRRAGPELWSVALAPPFRGEWRATLLDRGSSLASIPVSFNGGLGGVQSAAAGALEAYRTALFRPVRSPALWLLLFFASSLATTVLLRMKQ